MEVAQVVAPGGKKVSWSLLRHECHLLPFSLLCLPCVCIMVNQSLGMVCVEHVVCTCSG